MEVPPFLELLDDLVEFEGVTIELESRSNVSKNSFIESIIPSAFFTFSVICLLSSRVYLPCITTALVCLGFLDFFTLRSSELSSSSDLDLFLVSVEELSSTTTDSPRFSFCASFCFNTSKTFNVSLNLVREASRTTPIFDFLTLSTSSCCLCCLRRVLCDISICPP